MAGTEIARGDTPIYEFAGRLETMKPREARKIVDGRKQQVIGVAGQVIQALDGAAAPAHVTPAQVEFTSYGLADTDHNFPYKPETDRRIQAAAVVATNAFRVVAHQVGNDRPYWEKDYAATGGVQGEEFVRDAVNTVAMIAYTSIGDLVGRPGMDSNQVFMATQINPGVKGQGPERRGLNQQLRGALTVAVTAARDSYLQGRQ